MDNRNKHGLPATYRTPPAPYRERAYMQGPGFCRRRGGDRCIASVGMSICAMVAPHERKLALRLCDRVAVSNAPSGDTVGSCGGCKRVAVARAADGCGRAPKLITACRCFEFGANTGETPWPELLTYWGLPNLQVINSDIHAAKCATEARDRRAALPTVTSQ